MDTAKDKPAETPVPGSGFALLSTYDDQLSEVERTARMMLGIRVLDCQLSPAPLIHDPLGEALTGPDMMAVANKAAAHTYSAPPTREGHIHTGGATRAFLVDREVSLALQHLRSTHPAAGGYQVVNVGSGLDTRPWRMSDLGPDVCWWEVDMPDMITLKDNLLKQAAATNTTTTTKLQDPTTTATDPESAAPSTSHKCDDTLTSLKCGALKTVPCVLSAIGGGRGGAGLQAALMGAGFDAQKPTVWIAEGLVYYLDLPTLEGLLTDMTALSQPGSSVAIITCLSKEALSYLSSTCLPNTKIRMFTCVDDFATGGGRFPGSPSLVHDLGWSSPQQDPPAIDDMLEEALPGHYMVKSGRPGTEHIKSEMILTLKRGETMSTQ